jgi:hypothetical protein
VLLDAELAKLYGVATKVFNQAVKRNFKRFPADFLFQLNADEMNTLRSQIVTLKRGRGQHPKYLPYAFTEHGAIMVATILNSPRAIEMSIHVVRAFVQTRELLSSDKELARRFAQLETRLDKKLAEHDEAIAAILSAIRQRINPPIPKPRGIGFTADIEPKSLNRTIKVTWCPRQLQIIASTYNLVPQVLTFDEVVGCVEVTKCDLKCGGQRYFFVEESLDRGASMSTVTLSYKSVFRSMVRRHIVAQAVEIHSFGPAIGGSPFAARARSMRRRTNARRRSIAGLPNPRAWMASSRSRALGPA